MPKTTGGLGWLVQTLAGEKIDACVLGETFLQDADKAVVKTIRQYVRDIEVVGNNHAHKGGLCIIYNTTDCTCKISPTDSEYILHAHIHKRGLAAVEVVGTYIQYGFNEQQDEEVFNEMERIVGESELEHVIVVGDLNAQLQSTMIEYWTETEHRDRVSENPKRQSKRKRERGELLYKMLHNEKMLTTNGRKDGATELVKEPLYTFKTDLDTEGGTLLDYVAVRAHNIERCLEQRNIFDYSKAMKTKHALVVLKYDMPMEGKNKEKEEKTKRGTHRKRGKVTKYTQVFDKYAILNDEQVIEEYQTCSEQFFQKWYQECYIPTIQGGDEYTNAEKVDWLEETWAETLMHVANSTVPSTFVEEGKTRKRQQHSIVKPKWWNDQIKEAQKELQRLRKKLQDFTKMEDADAREIAEAKKWMQRKESEFKGMMITSTFNNSKIQRFKEIEQEFRHLIKIGHSKKAWDIMKDGIRQTKNREGGQPTPGSRPRTGKHSGAR
jgi:hypothetical protein